jgi:hypothetical protein
MQRFLLALGALLCWADANWADQLVNLDKGNAKLQEPFGIAFHPHRGPYVVELSGNRLRLIDAAWKSVADVAGTGVKGFAGDEGPASMAQLNGPHNLAITPAGMVLIADTWNNCIRQFDPTTNTITTLAGSDKKGYAGDNGPAKQALFNGVFCITLDPDGKLLYIADLDNRRIRKLTLATGIVTLVAGNGTKGVPMDGADAVSSPLVDPRAVATDRHGNVYILERGGHALRVVDAAGKIRTVAGTGKAGLAGDGGPALQAQLNGPKHLCVDRDDRVVIADSENHVIRRYIPKTGIIERVAGSGKKGGKLIENAPKETQLSRPHGVTIGPDGLLYIVDTYNHRILKLVPTETAK